jgi:cytochrome c-type biogenesis protein CcmH/NrfG
VVKEAINAMKEVVLLSDKVERAGSTLSELSKELREHDRRLLVIETTIDIAKHQRKRIEKD